MVELNSEVFSRAGPLLTAGDNDRTVRLWRVATGEVRTLEGHKIWIKSVAFSPDGTLLATGARDKTVRLWGLTDGRTARKSKSPTHRDYGVSFNQTWKLIGVELNYI